MGRARPAGPADREHVEAVLDYDPIESVAIGSWLAREGIDRGLSTGRVWLHGDAICHSGANLLPVNADASSAKAFARLALAEGRRCSSIVGRTPSTAVLWQELEPWWGPARAVRDRQFVMVCDGQVPVEGDPLVRRAQQSDLDPFYRASIEMYLAEIGSSPIAHDGGFSYRHRIRQLINRGLAFARIEDGQVVFKAELGALTTRCAQLQGVWVHPDWRGQGLGTAGTASVVRLARAAGMPMISLAVNDYNTPAVRSYLRCGFRIVGEQMVVLF